MKKYLVIIIIFVFCSILGIGYAQISSELLELDGSASMTPQSGLFILDANINSNIGANMTNTRINSYTQTNLNSSVSLSTTNSSSEVIMEITIYNNSGVTQYFDQVIYDENFYDNENIIVTLDNRLQNGQALNNQSSVTFYATFHYSSEYLQTATTPYDNNLNSFINFYFTDVVPANYHTVTYVNFQENNYPTSVLDGSNLVVTFQSPVPTALSVTGSNNYTYTNGVLTVTNVVNDLTIEDLSSYDFPVTETNQGVEWHTPRITNTNTVQVNDFLNMTFGGKNNTNQTINQITVTLTYTSTTGSNQSINCLLHVGETDYTETIQLRGKQTNGTVTVTFSGLNIAPGEEFTFTNSTAKITNANVTISDKKITASFANT